MTVTLSPPGEGEERWRDFSAQTFVDSGLLHYVNKMLFWPNGWALTASAWSERERLLPTLVAAVGAALENGPLEGTPESIAGLIFDRLILASRVINGFVITETDPPEAVQSGFTPDRQTELMASATEFIAKRRAEITP